ncbi:hypothetical protein E4631_25400 [Hymenobacter sp. UV11]|uniref:hypothetical protein n=1 Tax=Hymenobacter sp. UV11 TaxID=1849735 RepID=UPI00105B34AF|nr:hypothetical protein [Hymenobacter sp. UV11]TDN39162.1 hypothetical protein A8B98_20330 [Hymenobacter sp. UV11]TFZ62269.1 hypothetical protein E4631_25400 [Hymenobacter sp. UV11]
MNQPTVLITEAGPWAPGRELLPRQGPRPGLPIRSSGRRAHPSDKPPDKREPLERQVEAQPFFRVTRQYLVPPSSVAKLLLYLGGKRRRELPPPAAEEVVVSRARAPTLKRGLA